MTSPPMRASLAPSGRRKRPAKASWSRPPPLSFCRKACPITWGACSWAASRSGCARRRCALGHHRMQSDDGRGVPSASEQDRTRGARNPRAGRRTASAGQGSSIGVAGSIGVGQGSPSPVAPPGLVSWHLPYRRGFGPGRRGSRNFGIHASWRAHLGDPQHGVVLFPLVSISFGGTWRPPALAGAGPGRAATVARSRLRPGEASPFSQVAPAVSRSRPPSSALHAKGRRRAIPDA